MVALLPAFKSRERERFEAKLHRLAAGTAAPVLLIEATVEDVRDHRYKRRSTRTRSSAA